MTPLGICHRAQINHIKGTWCVGVLGILLLVRLYIGSKWYLAVLGEVIVLASDNHVWEHADTPPFAGKIFNCCAEIIARYRSITFGILL